MSDIVLSKGIRSNLLNLQKTADMTSTTQNRLATGKKVNTALDNPTNFFTSASLQTRANDLGSLLDGIGTGIQTLEAADNGLTAIKNVIESMQSTVRQARQDKSWASISYKLPTGGLTTSTKLNFSGGAVGSTAISVTLDPTSSAQDKNGDGALSVDEVVNYLNSSASGVADAISASNDNGQLRIKNLSTSDLSIGGITDGVVVNGAAGTESNTDGTANKIARNDVRFNLVDQFRVLRDQLDKISQDAQYSGVNLLQGDELKIFFNESGTSTINIQAVDETNTPRPIDCSTLGIIDPSEAEFQSDAALDTRLDALKSALNKIQAQASTFGSNLSVVENRQEFTKSMINTLKTGSDNLTLADQNEEAANLLALQTRQQLSQTALSLANQADQGVLRLFS